MKRTAPISLMESKANQIRQLIGEISEAAWRSNTSLPSMADAIRAIDNMESEIQIIRKEAC